MSYEQRCPCGSSAGSAAIESYPYTESGISNLTLKGVLVWTCANCGGKKAAIRSIAKLNDFIASLILTQRTHSAEELRFLATWKAGSVASSPKEIYWPSNE